MREEMNIRANYSSSCETQVILSWRQIFTCNLENKVQLWNCFIISYFVVKHIFSTKGVNYISQVASTHLFCLSFLDLSICELRWYSSASSVYWNNRKTSVTFKAFHEPFINHLSIHNWVHKLIILNQVFW